MIRDRYRFRAYHKGKWYDALYGENGFLILTDTGMEAVTKVFQCTGLIDCIDKKIWEGHIVTFEFDSLFGEFFCGYGVIEWSEEGYWELECQGTSTLLANSDIGELTVVGNTVENPELLEESS